MSPDALPADDYFPPDERRHVALPLILFAATCLSTFFVGAAGWNPFRYLGIFYRTAAVNWPQGSPLAALDEAWAVTANQVDWHQGFLYMGLLLALLLAHEMGHFLMTRRHRIPASFPYFLPVPIIPFGTLGAMIFMEGSRANRRELFDLGIAGPLAGLAVTVPILWLGILRLPDVPAGGQTLAFHNPLLLEQMIAWIRPGYQTPGVLCLNQFNPFLMAGWVGLLVTGLNMLPISQFDGGHVAYALLGRRGAHLLARTLIVGAILFILASEKYFWIVPLVLVLLLGVDHPPTADDRRRLGWLRRLLGWASLLIPILCFPAGGITPVGR
jgi:Zn-dependent protease